MKNLAGNLRLKSRTPPSPVADPSYMMMNIMMTRNHEIGYERFRVCKTGGWYGGPRVTYTKST